MLPFTATRGPGGKAGYGGPIGNGSPAIWLLGDSLNDLANGVDVETWEDVSGNRRHFQQFRNTDYGTAQFPVFSKASLNGHSGVTFTTYKHLRAGTKINLGDNITIMAAFSCTTGSIMGLFSTGGGSLAGGTTVAQRSEDSGCVDWYYNDPRIDLGLASGNHVLVVQAYADGGNSNNATLEAWKDGTHLGPTAAGAPHTIQWGDPDGASGELMRIGVYDDDFGGSNFPGTIYEWIWFASKLGSTDRTAWQTYLQTKYGL